MIIPNVNSDDESEPISVAALDAICRGEASLDDYSKMRIFLTLFSEEGIPDEQREPIWKSLAKIQVGEWDQVFHEMAEKPNEELDRAIMQDECNERYPVCKTLEPFEIITPDKE